MGVFSKREWKLLFTFWLVFIVFSQNLGWSELTRVDLAMSIVDEGSFSIDSYYQNTGDRVFFDGHYFSDKPPGSSFLSVPVYFMYKNLFGVPVVGTDLYAPLSTSFSWLLFLNILLITSLLGAISVVLVYRVSKFFTNKEAHSMLLVISYALGTIVFVYSRTFMNHIISAFLGVLALYLILRMKRDKKSKDYSLVVGLVIGFAIMNEYAMFLVFLALLSIFIYYFKSWKKTLLFLSGVVFFILLLGLYNYSIHGGVQPGFIYADKFLWNSYADCFNPVTEDERAYCSAVEKTDEEFCSLMTDSYYHDGCYYDLAVLKGSSEICSLIDDSEHQNICFARLLHDISFCEEVPNAYIDCLMTAKKSNAFYTVVLLFKDFKKSVFIFMRLSVYPYRGLLFYSPILILSFVGLFFMYRKYKFETIVIAGLWFLFMMYNVMLKVWWGGWCFGPRHLTALMPFLMIPLLFSFKKTNKYLIFVLIGISIFFNLLGLQMPEEMALGVPVENFSPIGVPLFNYYLPLLFTNGPQTILLSNLIGTSALVNILLALAIVVLLWKKELNFF